MKQNINNIMLLHSIGGAVLAIFGMFATYEYINNGELIYALKLLGLGIIVPIITSSISFIIIKKSHENENRPQ